MGGVDAVLAWPRDADGELHAGFHRVLHAAVEAGGAIGYEHPLARSDSDRAARLDAHRRARG